MRKRAVTDGRIEGSTLAEKRRWQQHKKGGKQTTKRGRKKGGKTEAFAVPDMGLEPMIFSPAAGQIACEFSFA